VVFTEARQIGSPEAKAQQQEILRLLDEAGAAR
jgi:hypothetical protein